MTGPGNIVELHDVTVLLGGRRDNAQPVTRAQGGV